MAEAVDNAAAIVTAISPGSPKAARPALDSATSPFSITAFVPVSIGTARHTST